MLAALIIGSIRTAAGFTTDPAAILGLLNDGLVGRGVVTCLVLRVDAEGQVSAANAGHPAPYLNGHEVAIPGALPLGMLREAEFALATWRMMKGETLFLITDGVAEAQDVHGRLFGFDNVERFLRIQPSAELLANAAQRFGQQDDITVLSVCRQQDDRDRLLQSQIDHAEILHAN
jgi:serine phosphatase RsbU (regulator of sigma subunit)